MKSSQRQACGKHAIVISSEVLEQRRLFAATLANGTLAVDGTDGNDTITFTQRGTTLTVRVNADRVTMNLDDVDEILVNGAGGDDRITLGPRVDVPAVIDGGDGDDRITGGRADDIITGGNGDDRVAGGSGDDQLFGAAGNDRLFGDAGDDDLSGGDGVDLLNGGVGFDSTDLGSDLVTGVENRGDGTLDGDSSDSPFSNDDFGVVFTPAGFRGNPLVPLDTTGFNVRPGTDVISPFLSSNPAGNQVFVDSFQGAVIQSGSAFIVLPGTGAVGREMGQVPLAGQRMVARHH